MIMSMILPHRLFGMTAEKGQLGKERDKRWRSVFYHFFFRNGVLPKRRRSVSFLEIYFFSQTPAVLVLELGRP